MNHALSPVRSAYHARIAQLSEKSVTKHFDAYEDVDWNAPGSRLDPRDPRFQKGEDDPLGATDWYRSQPEEVRSRLGLHHIASQMRIGVEFEAVLSRGLLDLATALPHGAPEFRYAYHEIIEEGQHSLMFQEFVNRTGLRVDGLLGVEAAGARVVPTFARSFPELFFLCVLGGEVPIDHVQRKALRGRDIHPLYQRVMQIHVTEEARHVCFAKTYLKEHVPELGAFRRLRLRVGAPVLLSVMARQMLALPPRLVREYGVPKAVLREAYGGDAYRAQMIESLEPVRSLCHELGLVTALTAKAWRAFGIAPALSAPPRLPPAGGPAALPPRRRPVPGAIRALPAEWLRPVGGGSC